MYKITYNDNTFFNCENGVENSLWNNIEPKSIISLEYSLFDKTYKFGGFEKYNHIILNGVGIGTSISGIMAVFVMGLYKGKVHRIIFNYLNKKIYKSTVEWKFAFRGYPYLVGWKEGIISDKIPTIYEV